MAVALQDAGFSTAGPCSSLYTLPLPNILWNCIVYKSKSMKQQSGVIIGPITIFFLNPNLVKWDKYRQGRCGQQAGI